MDIWDYINRCEAEAEELSLTLDTPIEWIPFAAGESSESYSQRGMITSTMYLDDTAFIVRDETIYVDHVNNCVKRAFYSYYLVIGDEIGGYEHDAAHGPHRHCSKNKTHERFEATEISFKEAAGKAWDYLSTHYENKNAPSD